MAKKVILGSVDLEHVSPNFAWYVVVTQFNYEEKYIENVMLATRDSDFEELIDSYYIPIKYSKTFDTLVDGSKKEKIHKVKGCYSNYVFIKCKMTKELWNLLRTTTGASLILTTGGIPQALSDSEINHVRYNQRPEGFRPEEAKKLLDSLNRFQPRNNISRNSSVSINVISAEEKNCFYNFFKDNTILFGDIYSDLTDEVKSFYNKEKSVS